MTILLPVQTVWSLSNEVVADLKEVFMLFDKDEDGVLSFQEVQVVMKSMGQRPSGMQLFLKKLVQHYCRRGTAWEGARGV